MDKKYEIGIPEMDAQHKKIFEIVDRAKAAENDIDMSQITLELIEYIREHLEKEELLIKDQPVLTHLYIQHNKKHNIFRIRAIELYDELRASESAAMKKIIINNIIEFCEHWITEHINIEDREYAELMLKQK